LPLQLPEQVLLLLLLVIPACASKKAAVGCACCLYFELAPNNGMIAACTPPAPAVNLLLHAFNL
jgi:hypothetical protein